MNAVQPVRGDVIPFPARRGAARSRSFRCRQQGLRMLAGALLAAVAFAGILL